MKSNAGWVPVAVLLGVLCGCGGAEKKTPAASANEAAGAVQEGLSEAKKSELKAQFKAAAEKSINAENAEAELKKLEQELEADK